MRILISTSNKGKLIELENILGSEYEILSKSDFELENLDVIEDKETLEENAYIKAKALFDLTGENVIADDTGLFVNSLGGAPGVYSARYAGNNCADDDNNEKLLSELEKFDDRTAYFETVICFISKKGDVHYVRGRLDGVISTQKQGDGGFGYDPLFIFDGEKSLSQISLDEKNKISHRAKALKNLKELLKELKKE